MKTCHNSIQYVTHKGLGICDVADDTGRLLLVNVASVTIAKLNVRLFSARLIIIVATVVLAALIKLMLHVCSINVTDLYQHRNSTETAST